MKSVNRHLPTHHLRLLHSFFPLMQHSEVEQMLEANNGRLLQQMVCPCPPSHAHFA